MLAFEGPKQLPVGTHGLFNVDTGQELGKLVTAGGRETWIWRTDITGAVFPDSFLLKIGTTPERAARAAVVFEYADGTFNGSKGYRTIPDPSESLVYQISRDGTTIGYLSLGLSSAIGAYTTWYVGAINASKRLDVVQDQELTFTKLPSSVSSYDCFTESYPRKPLMA